MGSGPESRHRDGGVDVELAGDRDHDGYRQAEADLAQVRIPVLLHADRPHERLYVAALDGTGNSMFDDKPEHWSTVAKIAYQVEELESGGEKRIAGGYVEGTFTQNGILRTPERLWDGRFGHTFDERVETAYFQLCTQAKAWLQEDPRAQIRVAGVGFSRGAEETAALLRMVHERGIRDPDGAKYTMNDESLITRIQYADRPPLVEPGKTLQAALLLDPVPTGVEEHDRRLPPSTLSTVQITAQHERRDLFKASLHIPPGFSEDNRNYNAIVPGGHGNMADIYGRNGLGTLNFNLGVEFLNRLSDRPYLEKRPVPDDPGQFVIHRSDQHMGGLYGTRGYDKDGKRDHVDNLAPERLCRQGVVEDCRRKAPISEELDAQVERRTAAPPMDTVEVRDAQDGTAERLHPVQPQAWPGLNDIVERLARNGSGKDGDIMSAVVDEYLRSPWAGKFQADVAKEMAREAEPSQAPFATPIQTETVREPPAVVR